MKRFFLAATTALVFMGCSKDSSFDPSNVENSYDNGSQITIHATNEEFGADTRIAIDDLGKTWIWSVNDQVSIVDDNGDYVATLSAVEVVDNNVTFTGSASLEEDATYSLVYPSIAQGENRSDRQLLDIAHNLADGNTSSIAQRGWLATPEFTYNSTSATSVTFKHEMSYCAVILKRATILGYQRAVWGDVAQIAIESDINGDYEVVGSSAIADNEWSTKDADINMFVMARPTASSNLRLRLLMDGTDTYIYYTIPSAMALEAKNIYSMQATGYDTTNTYRADKWWCDEFVATLPSAGKMGEQVAAMETAKIDLPKIKTLHISGKGFNATDIANVNSSFTALTTLDLSGLTAYTSIGGSAFSTFTKLEHFVFSPATTAINGSAFKGCVALESITIPNTIKTIASNAFINCIGLKSVELEEGLPQIGSAMFSGCTSLESVTIPASISSWNSEGSAGNTFLNCTSLKSVTFTEGLTCIGSNAFQGCIALEAINLPSTLTKWEANGSKQSLAFMGCKKATTISIPEGVEEIGALAFSQCESVTEVTIPSTVTRYPKSSADVNQAFQACTGITKVTFADGLTTVISNLFQGCTGIKEIYSHSAAPPTITPATVANVADTYFAVQTGKVATPTYIPAGSTAAYQAAEGWSKQTNYIEMD